MRRIAGATATFVAIAMFASGAAVARDAASGIAAGKRIHGKPLAIRNSGRAAPSPIPIPYPNTGRATQGTTSPQPGGGHRLRR